jgi:hypothetical protein
MNHIKPEKWSKEWFDLATTDELLLSNKEARNFLEMNPSIDHHRRSIWEERIRRISSELEQRKTSGEEWEEP